MTEKGQHVLDLIKNNFTVEWFTAKVLSEKVGEKIAAATLSSLARQKFLVADDSSPKQYRLAGAGEDVGVSTMAVEDKEVSQRAIDRLFKVKADIQNKLDAILHWMDNATYAEEPGSMKGIYRIVAKAGSYKDKVVYIGQTGGKGEGKATFDSRWAEHKEQLLHGTHHCAKLQQYFNEELNGNIDLLRFEIQQELPSDEHLIDLRERYWIQKYDEIQGDYKLLNTLHPSLEHGAELEPLSENDYNEVELSIEQKRLIGLQKLTRSIASSIHDYLYSAVKLSDQDKASLISGIIIALNWKSFRDSYRMPDDAGSFIDSFMSALSRSLRNYKGLKTNYEPIYSVFSFIETNDNFKKTIEYQGKTYIALQFLTEIIEDSIVKIAKQYPQYDVMGDFYNEFTSRSGADQSSLGIVLTPHHVADFMSELLQINDNDVIMDTCCGTGGLLLTADKHSKATNKIIGVEYNPRMCAIALANFIRRDSNAVLWNGDSYSEEILDEIQKLQPTKRIINPPYSQAGYPEIGFIKRGLDQLIPGGLGVAIVPRSCAIKNTAELKSLKEDILSHHTLLAAFSMPDQLFYPVGVVTIVLLFKAHVPNGDYQTFFGSLKDDGFEITRTGGRQDVRHQWLQIKDEMIHAFRTSQELAGKTAMHSVNASTEWCCEAYLKTNYTQLTTPDFEQTLKHFFSFKINSEETNASPKQSSILPPVSKWKEFKYADLFERTRGQGGRARAAKQNPGKNPYIGASAENNGTTFWTSLEPTEAEGAITVSNNGSVGAAFYQDRPFLASSDVSVLRLKDRALTKQIGLFIITVIGQEKTKYGYGRKWGLSRMKESFIALPATPEGQPDYDLMERYINSLPYSANL